MKKWIKYGLLWGLWMLLCINIILPLVEKDFNWTNVLIGLPIWTTAGLAFGYFMFGKTIKNTIKS